MSLMHESVHSRNFRKKQCMSKQTDFLRLDLLLTYFNFCPKRFSKIWSAAYLGVGLIHRCFWNKADETVPSDVTQKTNCTCIVTIKNG